MNRFLAQLISFVTHPLLMASLLFYILFHFAPSTLRPFRDESIGSFMTLIFLTTFCIPALSVTVMKLTGSIQSLQMEEHKERLMPFLFIVIFYGLTTYFFMFKLETSNNMRLIFLVLTITIAFLTLLTVFIKVSMHSAGIGGLVGFIIALKLGYPHEALLWPLVVAILVAGMTMSARLSLNVHRPKEVYLGAILGFSICFLGALLYL